MTQSFTGELGDSYRPGVDLFVVYNQSWEAADLGAPVERDRRATSSTRDVRRNRAN